MDPAKVAGMEAAAKNLADFYGGLKVTKMNDKGMLQAKYNDGTSALIKQEGGVLLKLPTGETLIITPAGKWLQKTADGKQVPYTRPGADPEPATQAAPKPPSPKKAPKTPPQAPAQAPKKKRKVVTASSSGSSSSSSDSSSDSSSEEVQKKAPRKAAAKKTTSPKKRKAAPKKAPQPKLSPKTRKRKIEDSEESEAEKEEVIDLNDDDKATLRLIMLKMAETLDLTEARKNEAAWLAAEEEKNKKPPKRPVRNAFPATIDALEKKIETLRTKLRNEEAACGIKDESKEVSLQTSLGNYIDPRVVCAWCSREDVSWTRIYNKTLVKKFPWAKNVDPNWRF